MGFQQGITQGMRQGEVRGLERGKVEGSRQKALETAKTMLAMGYPLGDICKISGLSQDEVQSVGNV